MGRIRNEVVERLLDKIPSTDEGKEGITRREEISLNILI